jgi:hypothetical protein
MKRLAVLLCALLCAFALGFGCAAQDYNGPLGPALRDWRGDNMQMRGFADQPPQPIKPAY